MDSNSVKRITVFCGHYGSGKTNVAVNYALWLKQFNERVSIADLDIVNPYFRTKDSMKVLEEHGIKLISSEYANSNVDTPALPAETYSIISDQSVMGVLDVGGDDRGALALGRYCDGIVENGSYEVLLVINKYRPMTRDVKSTVEICREIESACHMNITGIVNNSNIGDETTPDDVLCTVSYADEVAKALGVPVKMTTVCDRVYDELKDKIENVMPIKLYVIQSFLRKE